MTTIPYKDLFEYKMEETNKNTVVKIESKRLQRIHDFDYEATSKEFEQEDSEQQTGQLENKP